MKNKNIRVYGSGAKFKGKGKYTKSFRYCMKLGCSATLGWKRGRYKAYCRSCIRKLKLERTRKLDVSELNKPGWNNQFIDSPSVYEVKQPSKEQMREVFHKITPYLPHYYVRAKYMPIKQVKALIDSGKL